MTTIHLEPNMVPAHLKGAYSGRQFTAQVCETVDIPITAGLWDGGSRDVYHVVRLSDGASLDPFDQSAAPWSPKRRERAVMLEPGIAVVRHSHFCGKDHGLTFYVHPADAAKMLPAPVELDSDERLVLKYTIERKSSYGGRDRYGMAQDDARYSTSTDRAAFPTRAQWDEAKARLIERGLLNKAGAVTVSGRNAAGSRY